MLTLLMLERGWVCDKMLTLLMLKSGGVGKFGHKAKIKIKSYN